MKKIFLLLAALMSLAWLGGCTSISAQGTLAGLSDRLVYATVNSDETCGLMAPTSGLAFQYQSKTGPYRMVEAYAYDVGNNWASAAAAMPLTAYVPDGTPQLKDGDVVLIRMGDAKYIAGFDSADPSPFTGESNTVITRAFKSGWMGIGSAYAGRPTTGHNQSPWEREPWGESVREYSLHFTRFWKTDEAKGTCSALHEFPEEAAPGRVGLPTWPARTDN
jgi:hypothetical protein